MQDNDRTRRTKVLGLGQGFGEQLNGPVAVAPPEIDSVLTGLSSPANVVQVLDAIPMAVIIIDQLGAIRSFSRQAEDMFGFSQAEIMGQNIKTLTSPAIAARHDDYLAEHLRTGERHIIGSNRIEMAQHRSGYLFPVELRVSNIQIDGEPAFIGFLRELTGTEFQKRDPKSMLADLAQASRVSAMGALATSIAHELNQPLTNISNYTKGLCNLVARQEAFEGRDEVIRILEDCSHQAVRAGQLIHRLRDFVKGGVPHSEPNPVQHLIRDATALAIINGYKRAIHITYELPDELPPVQIDHLQGQQVLFNLLRNAIEALEVRPGVRHEVLIRARQVDDDFVEISIEDDGPGIDPAIEDSLFQSFVTTKGGGMGVGLAICKQIVESVGGQIRAGRSDALGGAAFHFTLPVSHGDAEES